MLNSRGLLGVNTSELVGFDVSGVTGTAYASLTAPGAPSSQLYTLNLNTGSATLVGTIGGGARIQGLSAAPVPEPSTICCLRRDWLELPHSPAAGAGYHSNPGRT